MDESAWDERYAGEELLWGSAPNQFLVAEVAGLEPGRAVDLACGEGRNAIWLAEQGWRTTGVDFSAVGLGKARRLAEARGVDVTWVESAVEDWIPAEEVDLVAVFYLQLASPQRAAALRRASSALAPGGTLLVVAHDLDNLTRGVGGPQHSDVLYTVAETADIMRASGLEIEHAEQVIRLVETDAGEREAIDTLVRARRPPVARS